MKARVAGSLAFFFVGGARADTPPTFWDLGKNPDALEQYRRHVAIERDMEVEGVLSDDIMPLGVHARQAAIDDARDIIDSTPNKDVWLRFDEGWVAVKRDEPRRAIPILEAVAKELDRSWFADEVWQRLAEAYVKAERTTDEIHAYDEVLVRVTSDSERLTPLLNQGEALLRAGNAEGAVEQFRDVLRLSAIVPNGNTVGVLAQWDLALALDRAGDPRSAVLAARSAVRMDRRCIAFVDGDLKFMSVCRPDAAFYVVPPGLFPVAKENKSVYFVPEYERDWYLALGYEALALEGGTPSEVDHDWRDADVHMTKYVDQAAGHGGDRWLDLARKRMESIRKSRAEQQREHEKGGGATRARSL